MSALMAKIARVDVDRVYFGLGEAVPLDQVKAGDFVFGPTELIPALPAGAVYVAEDCDLPAGPLPPGEDRDPRAGDGEARRAGESSDERDDTVPPAMPKPRRPIRPTATPP
jgi:hypothetical protein